MKKSEVKIGNVYVVAVSGKLAPVRLIAESRFGGWDGINLRTNRDVHIKTAARLRAKTRCQRCPNCLAAAAERTRVERELLGMPLNSPERLAIRVEWVKFAKAHACES